MRANCLKQLWRKIRGRKIETPNEIVPARSPASDNFWYRLATVHGIDDKAQAENRKTWNRYMSAWLTDTQRKSLLDRGSHTDEELSPLSKDEIDQIRQRLHSLNVMLPDRDKFPSLFYTRFDHDLDMSHYLFIQNVSFDNCLFAQVARFSNAIFFGGAEFSGARFENFVYFDNVEFHQKIDFIETRFLYPEFVTFSNTKFMAEVSFRNAFFKGFSSFDHAEFHNKTSFENVTFKNQPPTFFDAKLHEGTVWPRMDRWPLPKYPQTARDFILAYEKLKQEMDRLKKQDDEMGFFILELKCKRLQQGWLQGIPIAVYGSLCDYGRSYMLPFGWLLAITILFALPIWGWLGKTHWARALAISAANTFGVLGVRRDFVDPSILSCQPGWLRVITAVQFVLGGVLLFCFGLGLRNRFRLK